MVANENQVGGAHYKADTQHWDLMWGLYGPAYFKAQITRYVSRWRRKEGVKDLQKAAHYTEKLIECAKADGVVFELRDDTLQGAALLNQFFEANDLSVEDADIVAATLGAESVGDLLAIHEVLHSMIADLHSMLAEQRN